MRARPGFDWGHVAWGAGDAPTGALCSYCSAGIPEDSVPLIMWRGDGASARFCDRCSERWFGLTMGEPEPE